MRHRDRIALRRSIARYTEELVYDDLHPDWLNDLWESKRGKYWKGKDVLLECYQVYAQVAAAMSKIDPTIRLRKPPTETRG